MDGESRRLVCSEDTEVHQLNKQMMDVSGVDSHQTLVAAQTHVNSH